MKVYVFCFILSIFFLSFVSPVDVDKFVDNVGFVKFPEHIDSLLNHIEDETGVIMVIRLEKNMPSHGYGVWSRAVARSLNLNNMGIPKKNVLISYFEDKDMFYVANHESSSLSDKDLSRFVKSLKYSFGTKDESSVTLSIISFANNAFGVKDVDASVLCIDYIAAFEGYKNFAYPDPEDSKDQFSIGIGHLMGGEESMYAFAKVLPSVNYKDVHSGKVGLTDSQVIDLFNYDIKDKIATTKRVFPKYSKYPYFLKCALINGIYRGEFEDTHDTVKFINSNNWPAVVTNYINRTDYRKAEKGISPGIKDRMDCNLQAFIKMVDFPNNVF